MKLIKLTRKDDHPLWINTNYISIITTNLQGSMIFIAGENNEFYLVKESPRRVIQLITGKGGRTKRRSSVKNAPAILPTPTSKP